MRNVRSTLPPLDLLVFFEAAFRRGSFTGCAAELHVSQVAVSKRIRQLEEWVGEPLFIRTGKRLVATESGKKLSQTAGMALEFLRHGLGNLRENASRPLSIAAQTTIGMFWLVPQLQAFGLSADACPTRLTTSDNSSDLLTDKNDLVVAYGSGDIPGWQTTLLLEEELTPMASPAVAERLKAGPGKSFADLRSADAPPLLSYPRAAPDWVDWRAWLSAPSLSGADRWPMEPRSTYSQTIGEAIRGRGIALGSLALLYPELRAGRLVQLSKDTLRTGRGYFLCQNATHPLSRDAQQLATLLIAAAEQQRHREGHAAADVSS